MEKLPSQDALTSVKLWVTKMCDLTAGCSTFEINTGDPIAVFAQSGTGHSPLCDWLYSVRNILTEYKLHDD